MTGAVTASADATARDDARGGAGLPWAAAAAAGAVLSGYLVVWGRRYGLDLAVYRDAVQMWHRGANPYDAAFTASRLDFTYPPFALVVLSALSWGSFALIQWVLWVLSIGAAVASVVIVVRDQGAGRGVRLWCWSFVWVAVGALVLEPARSGLDYGQIEFVLMFVVVADLLAVPAPFRGVLLGIASAIKLTPLVFVIVLLTRRDWASTVRAVVSFAVWSGLTWLLWPAESRAYWLGDLARTSRIGKVTDPSNQSWNAVLHRPPFAPTGLPPVWALLSLATLGLGSLIAWRCARTGRDAFAVVAVAFTGLLVSPISWSHHWVWVLLVPPLLVGGRGRAVSPAVRFLMWGLVVLAVAGPYRWWSGGIREALDAVVPVWTFTLLAVWGAAELSESRRVQALVYGSLEPSGS